MDEKPDLDGWTLTDGVNPKSMRGIGILTLLAIAATVIVAVMAWG